MERIWSVLADHAYLFAGGMAAAGAGAAILAAMIRQRNRALLRYNLLSQSTRTIVLLFRPDGAIADANEAAVAAYGYSRRELLQMNIADLCTSNPTPAMLEKHIFREIGNRTYEGVHRRKDGTTFAAEATTATGHFSGERLALMLVQDITQRKQQETARALLHDMARLLLQKEPLDEILSYLCREVAALYGYPLVWVALPRGDGSVRPAAAAGVGVRRLEGTEVRWAPEPVGPTGQAIATGEDQLTWVAADPRIVMEPENSQIFGAWTVLSVPLTVERRTLGALSFYSPAHDAFEPGQAHYLRYFADQVALTMQAYEEQQHFEAHLRHQALHDPLTGLPNRQAVQEHLRQAVRRARPDRQLALLLMDLDHFKLVNDALGHTGGDEFLGALARSLKGVLEPGVLLARWEGDEFAVVLEETTSDQAQTVAGLVHQTASNFRLDRSGRSFTTGASIGIAMSDGKVDDPALLALADSALFTAKELGKNQVVLYHSDQDLSSDLAEDHQVAAAIRAALREDTFVLHFQPVVRLATSTIDHHEALLRLPSADGGLLLPGKFLRAAERFRLMPAIDQWVVHKVLELLHRDPHIRVFVNLSGQSLDDELLLSDLEQSLQARPDLASRLSFEITETAAIRDLDRIAGWMRRIRELGARFALDDFGMGFSSFAYLRALPTDYVKIDGSFIRNLDTNATDRSLVQAINQAAHTLGKTVVAEWIENETLARLVADLGIEYGQGFYWGAPAPYKPSNTEEPASL